MTNDEHDCQQRHGVHSCEPAQRGAHARQRRRRARVGAGVFDVAATWATQLFVIGVSGDAGRKDQVSE